MSILKSGVVEGMAYTLYSDGSIEAQLPGGTVRFGSITELRNHIEKNGLTAAESPCTPGACIRYSCIAIE